MFAGQPKTLIPKNTFAVLNESPHRSTVWTTFSDVLVVGPQSRQAVDEHDAVFDSEDALIDEIS